MKERLSPNAQMLLWAYERASPPYDILCAILALLLLLVPARVWNDPLAGGTPGTAQGTSGR